MCTGSAHTRPDTLGHLASFAVGQLCHTSHMGGGWGDLEHSRDHMIELSGSSLVVALSTTVVGVATLNTVQLYNTSRYIVTKVGGYNTAYTGQYPY